MMREKSRFQARGDDGRTYTVVERVDVINAGSYGDPHATIEGLTEFRLSTGEAINYVDDQTLRIVSSGVTLTRA